MCVCECVSECGSVGVGVWGSGGCGLAGPVLYTVTMF